MPKRRTTGQQTVHIGNEQIINDLCVGQQKRRRTTVFGFLRRTTSDQHVSQIFLPFVAAVTGRDFKLHQGCTRHMRTQFGQRLPTTATCTCISMSIVSRLLVVVLVV
jgi:hypothetical protein